MSCDLHKRLSSSFASLAHLSLFEFFYISVNLPNLFAFVRLGGSSCSAWMRLGPLAVQLWFIDQASAWWVTCSPLVQRSCKKRQSKGGASTFEPDPMVQGLQSTKIPSHPGTTQFGQQTMFHLAATPRHLVLAEPQRSSRHLGLFACIKAAWDGLWLQSLEPPAAPLLEDKSFSAGSVDFKEFGWTSRTKDFTRMICWKPHSEMSSNWMLSSLKFGSSAEVVAG